MGRKTKYEPEQKQKNYDEYKKAISGNLTTYYGLIGDSFQKKINVLSQILNDAHHPSLGTYKERLLLKSITEYIPKKYEAGTGFIMFPLAVNTDEQKMGITNRHNFDVSRQLDIIIYDTHSYPVVFKDGDFVVVRPESVRAVIEVKGALDGNQITSFMDVFSDIGEKWSRCTEFYAERKLPKLHLPRLYVMNWSVGVDTTKNAKGTPKSDGERLRKGIVGYYKEYFKDDKSKLVNFPLVNSAIIYNDCIVDGTIYGDENGVRYGYYTKRGRLININEKKEKELVGDGTISSLISGINLSLESQFNPMFGYVDQSNKLSDHAHPHQGFSEFLQENEIHLINRHIKE